MRDQLMLHLNTNQSKGIACSNKVNEHEILSYATLKTQIKVKEQFIVRKDMDVNEHERLTNITLGHKLK